MKNARVSMEDMPAPLMACDDDDGDDDGDDFGDEPVGPMIALRSKTADVLEVPPPQGEQKRASVVGGDVLDAWMTRGWTLRTSINKHAGEMAGLKDVQIREGDTDRGLEEKMMASKRRVNELCEVNHQLRAAHVKKKIQMQELSAKIEALTLNLDIAARVEESARQASIMLLEEKTLTEEKQKQDMQLELSLAIEGSEERVVEISTDNQDLLDTNARNKKLLKEQAAAIKEGQKAIRHLQRQIHVLEGAQNVEKQAGRNESIPENAMPKSFKRHQTFNDDQDANGVLNANRQKDAALGCSKGLLRGAQAEKHLEEQKKRLEAQRKQATLDSSKNTSRTLADFKALPGLNLTSLLGISEDASGSSGARQSTNMPADDSL